MRVNIVKFRKDCIELVCESDADADMFFEKLIWHNHQVTRDRNNSRVLYLYDPGKEPFVPADQLHPQRKLPEVSRH